MNLFRRHKHGSNERGQILPMFAVFLVVVVLFVALAIDLGYAYVTKANLSKALDAAALRGMLNIAKGTATAGNIAASVFTANYQSSGRDSTVPTLLRADRYLTPQIPRHLAFSSRSMSPPPRPSTRFLLALCRACEP